MLTFFRMCSAHHESRTGVQTHIILGVCRESPCQAKALGAKGVCGGQALEAEALGAKGGLQARGGSPGRPRVWPGAPCLGSGAGSSSQGGWTVGGSSVAGAARSATAELTDL